MSVWHHSANRLTNGRCPSQLYFEVRNTTTCIYCGEALWTLLEEHPEKHVLQHAQSVMPGFNVRAIDQPREPHHRKFPGDEPRHTWLSSVPFEAHLRACPACGWWAAFREVLGLEGRLKSITTYGGIGALRLLDLADISTPIDEVRRYLMAKYDERFGVHPSLFENVVASVFRDAGYIVQVTGRSGDDGIDVILDGGGGTIGVQVKRYRHRIQVSQIRELTGSLLINNMTRGIFVTTSEFQSGADRTARLSADRGMPIELYDAQRFYDALRIVQLKKETLEQMRERLRPTLQHLVSVQNGPDVRLPRSYVEV